MIPFVMKMAKVFLLSITTIVIDNINLVNLR